MEDVLNIDFNASFSPDNFSFLLSEDFNTTYESYQPPGRLVTFIFFLLVCLVGLVGNALVLFVILWYKRMWRTTNIFIFSLAFGDFLYMFCLLFFAIEILQPLETWQCKLYWTLTALATFSSVFFLAIMSISVFLQTYFPAFYKKLKLRRAVLISLGIWILGLLLGIPLFLYANVDDFFDCQSSLHEATSFWKITVVSYRFSVAFLAPLVLIGVCLILSHCRVQRQEQSSDSTMMIGIKEDMVLLMILSLVFIIFWLPTHLLEIISEATSHWVFTEGNYYIISIIPYLKSCIYPFLYGFLSRNFKDSYKEIFCCKKVLESDNSQDNSNGRSADKSTVC